MPCSPLEQSQWTWAWSQRNRTTDDVAVVLAQSEDFTTPAIKLAGFAEAGEVEEDEGCGGVAAEVCLTEASGCGVHLLAELNVAHDGFATISKT